MTYEKFIKRDGKTYGPYLYESKRVNGKVVSKYHGYGEKRINKNFLLVFFSILFLVIFIAGFFLLKPSFQGRAVLNLEGSYEKDQGFNGLILLDLKKGEFVPANSTLSIENNDKIYNYLLSEIIEQSSQQGNYYVENKNLNGFGFGYGFAGERTIYPEVYFKFNIITENESLENLTDETSLTNETISEENNPLINTTTSDTDSIINESATSMEKTFLEDNLETQTKTTEINPDSETQLLPQTPLETSDESIEVPVKSASDSTSESSLGVVVGFLGFFQRVFLGLNPTGRATLNGINEIQGSVSYEHEFNYDIKDGERLEIIPESVRTESDDLSAGVLNVKQENNKVIITTNYSEESNGFGENYLSDSVERLIINFSSLNISLDRGNLKVKLIYDNEELSFYEITIEEELNVTAPIINETLENETINITQLNLTIINNESQNFSLYVNNLTDEEKQILIRTFGNFFVNSSSKLFKDRVIVTFKIGSYSSDYSYDFNLSNNSIKSLIEIDRTNWLRDLAKSLSSQRSPYRALNSFNEEFSLSDNFSLSNNFSIK